MAKQMARDRKLTAAEAAKYLAIRAEIEMEKPKIIATAQQARSDARRKQLARLCKDSKQREKPTD